MKNIFAAIFAIALCSPAYAGYWATFDSNGKLVVSGYLADTSTPIKPTAPITATNPLLFNITINTPDGATPLTTDQYNAVPNIALVNGTVTIVTPSAPTPTPSSQAATALDAGITITSTAYPDLNGTYSVDNQAQANITAISTYILTNPGKFPTGTSVYSYLDKSGLAHNFPNTAEFQAFASVVANYASALVIIEATNSGTLPSSSVTIP